MYMNMIAENIKCNGVYETNSEELLWFGIKFQVQVVSFLEALDKNKVILII